MVESGARASQEPKTPRAPRRRRGHLLKGLLVLIVLLAVGFCSQAARLRTRLSAYESSAIGFARQLSAAQRQHHEAEGRYGTLAELVESGLLDDAWLECEVSCARSGYRWAPVVGSDGFIGVAGVPVSYRRTGLRSFTLVEVGVVRAADRQGSPTTEDDPALP